jgi:hypothetical protein
VDGETNFSGNETSPSGAVNPRTIVFGLLLLVVAAIYFFYLPQ